MTVSGIIADRTGNYIITYILMFMLTLAGAVLLQGEYQVIQKQQKHWC